ncbi:MAG: hypothetical protein ABI760_01680 [Ferruginibacter sp.]
MKKIKWIGFAVLLISIGCTASKITTSWKAQNTVVQKYKKILVVGLIHEKDQNIQMNMEIHFVGDLQDLGYHSVSALQEYGPRAFDKMDENATSVKLKNSGVDAIITIVLMAKENDRKFIPNSKSKSPYASYYNRFWGYRTELDRRINKPGYYARNTKYFWESNFYDMRTQKLVYSVQTQSFDPANLASMGHAYGQMIVKDMVRQNILKRVDNMAGK